MTTDISHFNSQRGILTLIAPVSDNIPMALGCQPSSRSPAIASLDVRIVHRSTFL